MYVGYEIDLTGDSPVMGSCFGDSKMQTVCSNGNRGEAVHKPFGCAISKS